MKPIALKLVILAALSICATACDDTPKADDIHKAMDIANPKFEIDYNFLPKNPVWGKIANGSSTAPTISDHCPCDSDDPDDWKTAPDCSDQFSHYNSDEGKCPGDGGHLNYFPITYECNVCWADHSSLDDDYNFRLYRQDSALYTSNPDNSFTGFIQAEFDSDETVDNWDDTGTWWDDFHHNRVDESDQEARNAIDGKFAIVMGLANIDLQHGCHFELHPVYVMAVHVKDDPDDDRWAFFVRNWGNQGYCSTDQAYYKNDIIQDNIIKLKIPHDDITDAEFMANISSVNDDNNKLSIEWAIVEGGILFTFHLDEPESRTAFVGDLTIKWKNPDRPPGPRNDFNKGCGSATIGVNMSSVEEKEAQQIERLDTASRKELFMKLREQFQTKMNTPPRTVTLKKGAAPTKVLSKKELKKIDYSRMFYTVRDTATMVRKSKRINYIREFLKAKGIY